jgi:gliding motility-associated-like protein
MKKIRHILLSAGLAVAGFVNAQVAPGNTPCSAGCSTGGSYQNLTGQSGLGTYSCLYSTPNPNWLALGIANSGDIHLTLNQVSSSGYPIDVDFALYGPFTSVSAGCNGISGSSPTVDCSFSGSATEYVDITGAIAGQVYILLVTNFSGQPGTITLQPNSSSTGSINCSINFSATVTHVPATCNQANGSVTVTPSGGFPPYTYVWSIPGNPTTATVNNVPPGTYSVTVTSSPNPTTGQIVNPTTASVTVTNKTASFTATSTPASCPGGHDGTATANFAMQGGSAGLTATYAWNDPASQTTQTATGLLPGTYTCSITLSNGCTGTAVTTVGANAVAYSASSTLVSCPGGSDGTATATMTPVVGNLSYVWSDAASQASQTATGLPAGSYTVNITSDIGCAGTATVAVNEIPGMIATIASQTDPSCNSGSDGQITVNVTQGTAPYTYYWQNAAFAGGTATNLTAGTHTVTVTDANGCTVTISGTLGEPDPLAITSISEDAIVCPENTATLSVSGSGGSSPYTFTWYQNGTVAGTGPSVIVDPSEPVTQYCVTLSEQCGSPTADSCMTLSFPEEIVPYFVTDKPADCTPATFEFMNSSNNPDEIATTFLSFGDGSDTLLIGDASVPHTYVNPGSYTAEATITSIYGCVTSAVFTDIVTAIALPEADFNFSSNPTTIFETAIVMQDKSSSNVDQWQWLSPSSDPAASFSQNPTLVFPEGVTGVYPVTLIVTTPEGCKDTITRDLNVISDILFFAPNAFTPDGDEFNQTWKFSVIGIDEYNFELVIFNRWGETVFETKDPSQGWDGTFNGQVAPTGAYTWRAKVKAPDSDLKDDTYQGTITLIR